MVVYQGAAGPVREERVNGFVGDGFGPEAAPSQGGESGIRGRRQWAISEIPVKGPLAGQELRAIPHVDAFWFAWAAFHPSTSIYGGP